MRYLLTLALVTLVGCGEVESPPPADAYSEVDTAPHYCSIFVVTDRGLQIAPQPVHVRYGTSPQIESDSNRYTVLDYDVLTREYGEAEGWIVLWDHHTGTAFRGTFPYTVGRCKL